MPEDGYNEGSAMDELQTAVEKYVRESGDEGRILLNAVLVYETTTFDEDGKQIYNTQGRILQPGSLAGALGVLTAQQKRLNNYINDPDEED